MRAATRTCYFRHQQRRYFNPRCPCGQRPQMPLAGLHCVHFNPRCPCGQRLESRKQHCKLRYFNPRCPCGQRPARCFYNMAAFDISIHAAHAGSCPCGQRPLGTLPKDCRRIISIHAAHAGSDWLKSNAENNTQTYFNPRCPCGQRLSKGVQELSKHINFNPRCPCGQRLLFLMTERGKRLISIHAAHAGSDRYGGARARTVTLSFQSTLPMRAATGVYLKNSMSITISIHAAHAGSDLTIFKTNMSDILFQSTLPMRAAT